MEAGNAKEAIAALHDAFRLAADAALWNKGADAPKGP
jgi:hypothetical protein